VWGLEVLQLVNLWNLLAIAPAVIVYLPQVSPWFRER
jgi:hypothetical protein